MAEAYLSSSYYYHLLTKCLDVQTILDQLATLLPASGWTANGGDHYTSPVDAVGRSMHCEFTRVSATNLNLLVKDAMGATVGERRMYCHATLNGNVQIFYGQYHLIIDIIYGASAEWLCAGILDLTPAAQNAHSRYVYMAGSRPVAGTLSYQQFIYASMIDVSTVYHEDRIWTQSGGGNVGYGTMGGQYMYFPMETHVQQSAGVRLFAGRRYQQVLVGQELCDRQSLIRLPIAPGVLGSFRGVAGAGIMRTVRLACRVV